MCELTTPTIIDIKSKVQLEYLIFTVIYQIFF